MDNNQQVVKKKKKPWLVFVIIFVAIIIIIAAAGGGDDSSESGSSGGNNAGTNNGTQAITYEAVDLQKMLDDLDSNAMKAEQTYQNKYVQITGRIVNFDSDGSYINIEPVDADEWNFDTVQCYIKNDAQKQVLLNYSKGDVITIKGKIKSIGEVWGYTLDINEIQ